jgi:hypothetical protein
VLGLVLVMCAATSLLGSGDFPSPVGTVLVLLFGLALLPVGALLWRLALGPVPGGLLRTLASANLATAAAALAWYLAASGFSSAGSALAIATVAALALLAAAQLRAGRYRGVKTAPSAKVGLPPQTMRLRPVQTPTGSSRPTSGACGRGDQRSARGS